MKKFYIAIVLGTALTFSHLPNARADSTEPQTLFSEGKVFGEVRYRYEHVDQDNALRNANAHTVRTNLGFQTGVYKNFQGLVEGQLVRHLGARSFNSLENGRTAFSNVVDPDVAQLNRAWVEYTGLPSTSIKLGRHFLNWDNQRFIGTVGWRQNDQTYDGVSLTNTSIDNLTIRYSYIANVNRIFGDSAPPKNLEGQLHLTNISYKLADELTATGYGYLMDFDNISGLTGASADQSNQTFGLRLTGKIGLNEDWSVSYEAEAATQQDYGDSTLDYSANYYHIAPRVSGHGVTFGGGYEVLGGDGTDSFRTPLSTLHKFNGWADAFLVTPANGLEDAYLTAGYKFSGTNTALDGTKFTAFYHEFQGEEGGDFGSEWDFILVKSFDLPDMGQSFDKLNVLFKYADYSAEDAPYVDTQVAWLQFGIKF